MGLDVTGCTTIDQNEKIKIEFVNHDSRHLNIASKTCFQILYIRRQINSFDLFNTICDQSLQNSEYGALMTTKISMLNLAKTKSFQISKWKSVNSFEVHYLTSFFVDWSLCSLDFTLFQGYISLRVRLINLFVMQVKALKKLTQLAGNIMICFSAKFNISLYIPSTLLHPPFFINKMIKWFQALCSCFYEYFRLKLSGFVPSVALLYLFTLWEGILIDHIFLDHGIIRTTER